jgi:hypothetical protein
MANAFSKEERVAFESLLEGFNDALVLSRNVSIYQTDQTMMERTNNVIWRPMPYIVTSYNGTDMTSNFKDQTQLSVPATIGYQKSVPWIMTATELRDALQEGRLGDSAKQKLASDINVAVLTVASNQGTLVVPINAAAGKYDDVAQCDAIMNEIGVAMDSRYLALSTRDYNGMASNLAAVTRSFGNAKSDSAYERSQVGMVAGFDTYKMDYALRITANTEAGRTISTLDAAGNYYIPKAVTVASTGETSNVDNRYQRVTLDSTTNVRAGDAFTIANVNAVHAITKQDTGQLKTFRVISVDSSTQVTISPPIISNQVANDASAQYQNCVVTAKSATAGIVFRNSATRPINCFWHRDSIELLPGRYAVPSDAGAAVMRGSTDQGIELVMQKQYDINTMRTRYRIDTLFGVNMKQPEMAGVLLFNG